MKMNFTLKMWVACTALVGTLFGCSKKTDDGGIIGEKSLYITVEMPAMSSVVTRGVDDEVAIKRAYVVVYAAGAGAADLPKFTSEVKLEDISSDGNAGNKKISAFKAEDNIVAGDVINIIFNKELKDLNVSKGSLLAALKLSSATGLVDLKAGLPMYGSGEWTTNNSSVISVKRAVAKIQLKLDYNGENHVPGSMGSSFKTENTTYRLYQLSDVGNIDGSAVGVTGVSPITEIHNESEIDQLSAKEDDNYTGANFIFGYPYSAKSIGATPKDLDNKSFDPSRIAMVMKNIQNDGSAVYHRLDIYNKETSSYYDIFNHHHYSIVLSEINVGGYKTATEALNHPATNIKFDVIIDDGTVVEGQYALNVKEAGTEFTTNGASSIIEIAEVNRLTSVNAPIDGYTSFNVTKEDIFVLGDLDVEFTEVPTELDNSVKSLKITATGEGVATFRYKATLGSADHTSGIITVRSSGGYSMAIDGFVADLGMPNGYAVNKKFAVAKGFKFKVESTFKEEWDASLSSALPAVAPTKFTTSAKTISIAETLSDGTTVDGFYLNVYRTAPGDKDIVGSMDVTITSPEEKIYTFSVNITITTSCDLPGEAENYGVKINGLLWADRNCGSAMPDVSGYETSKNYSNDTNHPDYNDSSKSAIVGTPYGIIQTPGKCESLVLGNIEWCMPKSKVDVAECELTSANARVRHSKGRVFLVGDIGEDVPALRTIGCFLPLGGASATTTSGYWSNFANYSLNVSSTESSVVNGSESSEFSLRCVEQHYDIQPTATVEGFCPTEARINMTVLNGYDLHTLFGINKTTHTIVSAESSFNQYWDGLLSPSQSIDAVPTLLKSTGDYPMKSAVTDNLIYFHPFRTAPGDADISGFLRVKGITTSNLPFALELPLTIVTSCHLPTSVDNYSIIINGDSGSNFKVADRNVGSKLPDGGKYELSQNYTRQVGHPDYIPGRIGEIALGGIWGPQLPEIAAIIGEYHAFDSTTGMAEAVPACDGFKLGTEKWRLPTARYKSEEGGDMLKQYRHSKLRIFLLSTVTTKSSNSSSTEYSGVFFPAAGLSSYRFGDDSYYWTGSLSNDFTFFFALYPEGKSLIGESVRTPGYSVRCVATV